MNINTNDILFEDLAQIIEQGKKQAISRVNSTLTLVYWQLGHRINVDMLNNERAEYGKEVVAHISAQLEQAYGKSFQILRLSFHWCDN